MTADRKIGFPEAATQLTLEEIIRRAPEYKGSFETEEETARWMVYRMYYLLSEASDGRMDGLLGLRATIRDNKLDDATKLGQYFYEKEYLSSHLDEPPTILDKLIPTAREFAIMPGIERLPELKRRIRHGRMMLQTVTELVAEKRLMKMKSWQEQVANIDRKLSEGVENPNKVKRMEEARYHLERLIQSFEPSLHLF